jgi:hypothetical protein
MLRVGLVFFALLLTAAATCDHCQILDILNEPASIYVFICPNETFYLRRYSNRDEYFDEIPFRKSDITKLVGILIDWQYAKNAPGPYKQPTNPEDSHHNERL